MRCGDGLRNPDGTVARAGQGNLGRATNAAATRRVDGTGETHRGTRHASSTIPVSRLGQIQKASRIMGLPVNTPRSEKLGKVEDLLLDLSSGRIVVLIVSSGGLAGIGDELSAVPPTALRFAADRGSLELETTKELFSAAPHFKSNQWPDFTQPGPAGGVYRAYQVEPYFSAEPSTGVDGTRRNVRDREVPTNPRAE